MFGFIWRFEISKDTPIKSKNITIKTAMEQISVPMLNSIPINIELNICLIKMTNKIPNTAENSKEIILQNNNSKKVIDKYVRTFNIVGKTIYYVAQNNEEIAIYKVKTNGKKEEKIVDLQSVNVYINVVGNWIYYTDNTEDSIYYYSIYRIKTNASGNTISISGLFLLV